MSPKPLLQTSQSVSPVLLLAAREATVLPGVQVLLAAGIEARVRCLNATAASALDLGSSEFAENVAVIWFLGTEGEEAAAALASWRTAGYTGRIILVGEFLDPTCLAACFQAGLTDYLEASELVQLPQVLRRAASTLPIIARLEQRINRLEREKQELVARGRDRNEFFATMSHELRAPLANILGFAKMLRDCLYGPLNERQQQYAGAIFNCGEYLLELINNLLDLAKIEAEREELCWETVNVTEVCMASLEVVSGRAADRGLPLQLQVDPNLEECGADRLRLQQILINLLSNAIKFTDSGSVRLEAKRRDREVLFSVIDTGIGISERDLQNLFEPFRQVRPAKETATAGPGCRDRSDRGTGLGLALSRKLAQLHGGDITAASEPNRGSCFTLHLPIDAPIRHASDVPAAD